MTELAINAIRRTILEHAASNSHGSPEHKWSYDDNAKKAIAVLVQQKLVTREMGDVGKGFGTRLRITDRGQAALRGDMLTKI